MDPLHNRAMKEFQDLQKNKKDNSVQVKLVDNNIYNIKKISYLYIVLFILL